MLKRAACTFIIALCVILAFTPALSQAAQSSLPFDTGDNILLLMDPTSGMVLYGQNADKKVPIASVTKIMTLLLTFEAVESGDIFLDDLVTVSSRAASTDGSEAFLDAGAQYKL